jgi:type IV secretory pathway VirJ component
MLLRLIAPAALSAVVSVAVAADPAVTARTKQNPQVSKSTSVKAAPAKAKPRPPAHDPKAARILDVAGLGEVTIYAPQGEARGLALFASGDGGWNLGVWDMAQNAASLGYWVAGFSTPALLKSLENGDGACSDSAGLLDNLGEKVKIAMKLPSHYHPLLIGYSSGATIAYAALAQAGDKRFSGAMTLGFCPDLIIHKPFCEGAGLTAEKQPKPPYGIVFNTVPVVAAPWVVLQGDIDQVCNPPATVMFVDKVKNGKVVNLPHVGHGFGVPRNWMPQYRQGLIDLRDGGTAARITTQGK